MSGTEHDGDDRDDETARPRGPREERDAARVVRRPDGVPEGQLGPATGQSMPDASAMGMADDELEGDQVPPARSQRTAPPD